MISLHHVAVSRPAAKGGNENRVETLKPALTAWVACTWS
jgi:hypothetical protein